MARLKALWRFLGGEDNRKILAWLGAGALAAGAAVAALWKPTPAPPAPVPTVAQQTITGAPGGVTAGVITGGEFNLAPSPAPTPRQ